MFALTQPDWRKKDLSPKNVGPRGLAIGAFDVHFVFNHFPNDRFLFGFEFFFGGLPTAGRPLSEFILLFGGPNTFGKRNILGLVAIFGDCNKVINGIIVL